MTKLLAKQLKSAVFGGHSERLPFVIIGFGAWIALRLIGARKDRVLYSRALRPGEAITIKAPGGEE